MPRQGSRPASSTRFTLRLATGLLAAAGGISPALAQDGVPGQPNSGITTPPVRPPETQPPQPPPPGETPAAPQPADDGPAFEVTALILRYATSNPDQPPLEEYAGIPVRLSLKDGVYVAPREGLTTLDLTVGELETPGKRQLSVSALNAISTAIVKALNDRGIVGVLVTPDPSQIDPRTLEDRRAAAVRTLNIDIWTRTVGRVRTLGAGPRWAATTAKASNPSQETRVDNPRHARIRENSPLLAGDEGASGDVLRRDVLDEYLYRLNRHPGRRVEAAISAGDTPGDVVLDYIVTENKPWTLYFQLSNTGTEETNTWRERFGFEHFQLTGNDDIFRFDYITAGFDESNAVLLNYDRPIGNSDTLRGRLFGSWSDFTASDVGFEGENFSGDSWQFGGELALNIWQSRAAFIDLFAGARFEHVHVNNEAVALEGEEEFFLPYIGLRFDRTVAWADTHVDVRFETNVPSVAGTGDQVDLLGRIDVDKDWTTFKWAVNHSVYLDRFSSGGKPAVDAHEVALSFRGQYAFGNRLIPQEQDVIGGLYSVRGYDEALAAGDTVYVASAEYRYHLPRTWSPREPGTAFGRPFRWSPDRPGAWPDWDLILKGCLDAGRAENSDRLSFEQDETLLGAGVGLEVQFMRNVNLRVDWGVALKDAREVEAGESRLHFVGTLLW